MKDVAQGYRRHPDATVSVNEVRFISAKIGSTFSAGINVNGFAYRAFPNGINQKLRRIATLAYHTLKEFRTPTFPCSVSRASVDDLAQKYTVRRFQILGRSKREAFTIGTDYLGAGEEYDGANRQGQGDADDVCGFEKHGCSRILLLTINGRGNSPLKTTHANVLFP